MMPAGIASVSPLQRRECGGYPSRPQVSPHSENQPVIRFAFWMQPVEEQSILQNEGIPKQADHSPHVGEDDRTIQWRTLCSIRV